MTAGRLRLAQDPGHFRQELGFREPRYRRLQIGWRDFGFHFLETCDGLVELLFFRLDVEEVRRSAFQNSTLAERNDGLAAGQSLHGGDAEILLAGHDIEAAAGT